MSRLGRALSFALVLVLLSGCTTPEIERLKRQNEAKRAKLDRLLEQLASLDDQVFRQRAELRASRKRFDRASEENRVSAADRARIESELKASSDEVDRLREKIRLKTIETNRLKAKGSASEADRARRDELSKEIAQLQRQIDVLSNAMKRQAEARAGLYAK